MSLENRAFQRVDTLVSRERTQKFALGVFGQGLHTVVRHAVDPLREWHDRRQTPAPAPPSP